jgi:ribosomal protein L11 methyltransferase
MMHHIKIAFSRIEEETKQVLIAMLPDVGFAGMEEQDTDLLAYARDTEADMEGLVTLVTHLGLQFTQEDVPEENWNASWEANFEPVLLPGLVHVRAFFHPRLADIPHEILITPKMSFGTGHHATTRLMMKAMSTMDFSGKSVLDFGTGTGILSIFASKLGAKSVVAIDNDHWSIENVKENIQLNHCSDIEVLQLSSPKGLNPSHIVLANINRNVLEEQLIHIHQALHPGGTLVISGLFESDFEGINAAYSSFFGDPLSHTVENEWIAIVYVKKP